MFKKIMTGCLVALAVTMSACEYVEPEQLYPIWKGVHILRINDKPVTYDQKIEVDAERWEITHAHINDEDIIGIYEFYGFPARQSEGAPTISGGGIFKHQTKEYYLCGRQPDYSMHELNLATSPEPTWEEVMYTGYLSYAEPDYPFTIYLTALDNLGPAGNAPSGWGASISQRENQTVLLNGPPAVGPISAPITVYVDFTGYGITPFDDPPDYVALQYKETAEGDWITLSEVYNPPWWMLQRWEIPLLGRNIEINNLPDWGGGGYLRIYIAVGFWENFDPTSDGGSAVALPFYTQQETNMVKTLIIILSLITLVGLSVVAFEVIEYDADGNPIESTEIPADQIPPDSRPAVVIPAMDITIELAPIITAYTNATIEMTSAIKESIFDNYSAIAQGLSAISVISNTDAEVVIVDASRGTRTTITKATGMATISDAITGRAIKVVPYSSKLSEIMPSQGTLKQQMQQAKKGIVDYVKFIETAHPRNYVTDERTLAYMQNIEDTPEWREWQAIYSAEYAPIKHVPVEDITQIRMLAEMRAAESNSAYENLVRELKYFRTLTYTEKVGEVITTYQQYNTVLAVWEGENPSRLLQQIALAKSLGYKVFFSYGKRESLHDAVFIDPKLYTQGLTRFASECDGYFIGWRRTGLHLLQKQEKFVEYSMQCVRQANPNILIFGEGYFGFVGNHNPDGTPKMDDFKVNVPANASGARVVNFGYPGIRPEGVANFVRRETQVPLIVIIVGEKAYYMSRNNTNKTKAQNRSIIKGLERRFQRAGFGTATLAGDGSNEIYDKSVSDDLCKSQWSKTTISN